MPPMCLPLGSLNVPRELQACEATPSVRSFSTLLQLYNAEGLLLLPDTELLPSFFSPLTLSFCHCPCSDLLAFLIFSLDFLFFLPQYFPANTKKFAFQRNYQYFLWSTNQSISWLIRILVLVIFGFVHGSHYSESNTISFCFKNSVLHSASYA